MAKKQKKTRRKQREQMQGWQGQAANPGLLAGLTRNQQFMLGALIGAGAAWVLSDEAMRGKFMKAGMRLYGNLMGGFEEMKEQMADLRAELEAEQHGDA